MVRMMIRAAGLAIAAVPVAALAQGAPAQLEWTVRESPSSCSVSGQPDGGFLFLAINAEGGSIWRVHHPDMTIAQGEVVPGILEVDGAALAFEARGARTSDGTPGFTAAATEPVRAALGTGGEVTIRLEGGPPIAMGLAGLPSALTAMTNCAAKLKPRDPATIPVVRARALSFPSITRSDLPTAGATARVVAFRLGVAPDGSVSGCTIVESSGAPALDARVCEMLEEGAQFEPARNAAGDPVADTFQSRLKF